MSTVSDEKLLKIKNKIHKKVRFYSQLWAYLLVCSFLTFIDYFDKGKSGIYSLDWAYWVWLGWGIGIGFSFLSVFVYPDYEERMVQKEVDKQSSE